MVTISSGFFMDNYSSQSNVLALMSIAGILKICSKLQEDVFIEKNKLKTIEKNKLKTMLTLRLTHAIILFVITAEDSRCRKA